MRLCAIPHGLRPRDIMQWTPESNTLTCSQEFFDLPWWGYVAYTLGTTHLTIAAVTIYLRRHQAHRALELLASWFTVWRIGAGAQARAAFRR